ncbi:MAG: SufE family protein [Lentimicrobiaceae bacterium]|nr:SufE family protein [Lentimicrobiaceae bacterium]
MKTIQDIATELEREFGAFEDWMDKYNYLIEMGKSVPMIDPQFRTDAYLIKGCQSRVWLQAELVDGRVTFKADSDAVITRGIAAMLIRVFSGHKTQDIIAADTSFIDRIGLQEHLSPTRSNGLLSMLKQMKLFALAFQARESGKGQY